MLPACDSFRVRFPLTTILRSCAAATVVLVAVLTLLASPEQPSTSETLTITLAGQSMIRSDIRQTAAAAVPVIQTLLKGDIVFTNLEAAIALPGEKVSEGRGFL